jgi:hypothetical protein
MTGFPHAGDHNSAFAVETQLTGAVEILAELLIQFRDGFRFKLDSAFG